MSTQYHNHRWQSSLPARATDPRRARHISSMRREPTRRSALFHPPWERRVSRSPRSLRSPRRCTRSYSTTTNKRWIHPMARHQASTIQTEVGILGVHNHHLRMCPQDCRRKEPDSSWPPRLRTGGAVPDRCQHTRLDPKAGGVHRTEICELRRIVGTLGVPHTWI